MNRKKYIVAGTEKYDKKTLDKYPNLKVISRIGVGIDNIDLEECKRRNIKVFNTPTAPSNAVAELVIGQIFNALRDIEKCSEDLRNGIWHPYTGRELKNCKIGIIGFGNIGKRVFGKLLCLSSQQIFLNDIIKEKLPKIPFSFCATKEEIIKECDIITIHIPLKDGTIDNHDFITKKDLNKMKKDVILINTSRGEVINEKDLYEWLKKIPRAKAVIDVFKNEPYRGKLIELPNTYLTPHLGSYTKQSREDMKEGAIKNIQKYIKEEKKNGI